ncbi:hypothetical protein DL95DRAFT_411858 [Leptodontidium sp. 2 PMI_412]|nr:hypothetical protein DL95DRAFT_411858 [Leptodontidium sp. 2 PMI_412]
MVLPDSPGQFASKAYDFLIVGGGTAGLLLAARLSEDPNVTVGVLEAGENRVADPNVLVCGKVAAFNPNYDWGFSSVPQEHLKSRVVPQPRGRVLGGSSAINGMVATFASRTDIDNWGSLGNPGWFFDDLAPYYKKFATFTPPSKDNAAFYNANAVIDKDLHKSQGEGIRTSFPTTKMVAAKEWLDTFENLGLSLAEDPQGGGGLGGYTNLSTIDPADSTRSYSATAFFAPNTGRTNLTVLTSATVNKITFSHGTGHHQNAEPTATGVQFTSRGTEYHVSARREVILCAGTYQSPQILELSGVGSPAILSKYNIPVIVDLPSVGENMQEHSEVPLSYELAAPEPTLNDLVIPGVADAELVKFYASQSGILSMRIASCADLSYKQISRRHTIGDERLELFAKRSQLALDNCKNEGLKAQYKLQVASILNDEDTTAQLLFLPLGIDIAVPPGQTLIPTPGSFVTIISNHAHPFSRGTVHIASADPNAKPIIDPHYLEHEIDIQLLEDVVLFSQDLATTEPLASKLKDGGHGFKPGYYALDKDNIEDFVRRAAQSAYHPLGSCSMMPRKLGGVVSPKLQVYGTKGLRVVDASIFPMSIRNNTQTCVYAVAEKAADIIKDDWKHGHGHGFAEKTSNWKGKRGLEAEDNVERVEAPNSNGKRTRRG